MGRIEEVADLLDFVDALDHRARRGSGGETVSVREFAFALDLVCVALRALERGDARDGSSGVVRRPTREGGDVVPFERERGGAEAAVDLREGTAEESSPFSVRSRLLAGVADDAPGSLADRLRRLADELDALDAPTRSGDPRPGEVR